MNDHLEKPYNSYRLCPCRVYSRTDKQLHRIRRCSHAVERLTRMIHSSSYFGKLAATLSGLVHVCSRPGHNLHNITMSHFSSGNGHCVSIPSELVHVSSCSEKQMRRFRINISSGDDGKRGANVCSLVHAHRRAATRWPMCPSR